MIRTRIADFEIRANAAADDRTIPVVVSTAAPVARDGYSEILVHTPDAIDLSRAPLPLIESHDARTVNIGVVENLKIGNGKLTGIARFGESARANELLADIRAKVVTGLSVGYEILEFDDSKNGVLTVTKFRPLEISIVSIPADINAGFFKRDLTVNNETQVQTPIHNDAESSRVAAINGIFEINLVQRMDGAEALQNRALAFGWSEETTRKVVQNAIGDRNVSVVDHRGTTDDMLGIHHGNIPLTRQGSLAERFVASSAQQQHRFGPTVDYADELHDAAVNALAMRAGCKINDPSPMTLDLSRMSMRAIDKLFADGKVKRRGFGGTTSDFPSLLSNVASKIATVSMQELSADWRKFCRVISVPDFKATSLIGVSAFSGLTAIPEAGEYSQGQIVDTAESVRVATYGANFGLTRQAMVNDDLAEFGMLGRKFALAAHRKVAEIVFGLLTSNPVLAADNTAVFHANHANLTTGVGAPSVTTIGALSNKMRLQKDYGGTAYLNIKPAFLIAPIGLEMTAKTVIASGFYPLGAGTGETSPFAVSPLMNSLEVITDPALDAASASAWYLASNPTSQDTLIVAFLDSAGEDGVSVEQFQPDEKTDTSWFKIRLECGAAVADYRGLQKHAGA